jgi:DNA-binding GntR family transcriptional regulator
VLDALERRDAHDAARSLEMHIRRVRLTLSEELAKGEKDGA